MATKDDIIFLPHPSLRTRSKRVGFISDEVRQVIADMKAATMDWEASRKHEVGVALAAVQINQLIRVVIVRHNADDRNDHNFTVFINPEITKYDGEITEEHEGCLSIKNIYGLVPRYNRVKVKALDETGREFRVTAESFVARILQHEIDHTNGIVYIDHIKDRPDAFFRLDSTGQLHSIDYEKEIAANRILWE